MLLEKNALNPIMHDQDFLKVFAKHKIKVIAPASGIDPEKFQKVKLLTNLNIEIPEDLLGSGIPYHSNTDEIRYKQLKTALFDKSKKTIIWALRGGYGAARLIDKLEALPIPKQEKTFIGHSDITALHLFLSQQWGWNTIHGSGLSELVNPERDPQNFQKLADIISNKVLATHINHLKPLNKEAKSTQKISGRLTGGNLSIIQTSLGTNWQIKTTGKILFLEDTGEKGYKVDRTLNHLRQAGIFGKAKAIIFGDFVNPQDQHIDLALARFAANINIPVFKTNHFGHGKTNYPLLYNAKSQIMLSPDKKTFDLKMAIP